MSTGYPFCDSDCPSIVKSPRHVSRPSVFAFSYVPDNVCHTTLFPDPVCTLSVLQGDSYHDSFHLPLGCDQFLKLGVAKRPESHSHYVTNYWEHTFVKCFPLQSHWHIFVSHDVVPAYRMHSHPCPILLFISCTWSWSLVIICPRYTYLSTSSIFFPSTITSSLLTCLLHITFVFPRYILRPTGLLMSWISWSISCSFEVELAMRTISSAKIRWDKYSPSILTPLFSQLILLMMACCRHDSKSLGKRCYLPVWLLFKN